jgi:hypothetical protein
MIIIYNSRGDVATIDPKKSYKSLFSGSEEDQLLAIANAELANGTKFEISPFDVVDMEDRTLGSNWIYKGTGRERTSVALSDAAQTAYNSQRDTYEDAL